MSETNLTIHQLVALIKSTQAGTVSNYRAVMELCKRATVKHKPKVDAHNLMNFLRLRMASDAQLEIREYATAIYEHFFKPSLPWTAEAFERYRIGIL